jgi:hypothetical protein
MLTGEKFVKNLLDALLPNRAAPALGRVIKLHEGPGKTKYSCDVRIVTAGSYEDTGQVIAEVPLSPVWAANKKRGVYAIPPVDALVIVEFLESRNSTGTPRIRISREYGPTNTTRRRSARI